MALTNTKKTLLRDTLRFDIIQERDLHLKTYFSVDDYDICDRLDDTDKN